MRRAIPYKNSLAPIFRHRHTFILPTKSNEIHLKIPRSFYHEISFKTHGNPLKVLGHKSQKTNNVNTDVPSDFISVALAYSPINPADINTIEGVYPSPNPQTDAAAKSLRQSHYFPECTIGGSEGVGTVTHSRCSSFKVGDVVLPTLPGMGLWRSQMTAPASRFFHLPKEGLGLLSAATIAVNPCTAFRMLSDFVTLEDGDLVIQNGGGSGVGLMVSQLAARKGVACVSIVRRGKRTEEEFEKLRDYLLVVGRAALVWEEERLIGDRDAVKEFLEEVKALGNGTLPKLALNCVGGESATVLMRCLSRSGTMVTYGGMSKKPVTVPTGPFIFKDLRFCGYWHSRWCVESDCEGKERQRMIRDIAGAVLDGGVVMGKPKVFDLWEVEKAIGWSIGDGKENDEVVRRKAVFRCSEEV